MAINWSRRPDPRGDDLVDPDEETARVQRLLRLRERASNAGAADAAVVASAMSDDVAAGRCALADNAFAVLGVDLAASVAGISDAYEELSFEPDHDPAALAAARAALQSPRDRLEAELGWLPGLPLPSAAAVRTALRARNWPTLSAVREKAGGIARLNLGFALVETGTGAADLALQLLDDAQAVGAEALLAQLDDARFHAGFREIDSDAFDQCLDARARTIAVRLAPIFAGSAMARDGFTRGLQGLSPASGRFGTQFRDILLRDYGAAIGGALDEARKRVLAGIETLKAHPDSDAYATALVTSLDVWSGLRRPMQVHEAARGLDDPASADIFTAVRSLVIDISNEQKQFEIALRLARALLGCFRLVPARHAALQGELPVLIGNVLVRRTKQLVERAMAEQRPLARAIEAGALDGANGLAGAIATLVAEADDHPDDDIRTAVYLGVRDIGIKLHNERGEVRAAYIMTAWLAGRGPPPDIAAKLQEDLAHFGVKADVVARAGGAREPDEEAQDDRPAPAGFGRAKRQAPGAAGAPPRSAPGQAHKTIKPPRLPAAVARQRRPAKLRDYCLTAFLLCFVALPMCSRRHRPASTGADTTYVRTPQTAVPRSRSHGFDRRWAAQADTLRGQADDAVMRENARIRQAQPLPARTPNYASTPDGMGGAYAEETMNR